VKTWVLLQIHGYEIGQVFICVFRREFSQKSRKYLQTNSQVNWVCIRHMNQANSDNDSARNTDTGNIIVTSLPWGVQSIVMSVSACLSVIELRFNVSLDTN